MKGMGEEVLRAPVRDFLVARGYEVFDEVFIGGRFADLVGIRGEDEVVGVELKLAQWRVALLQAKAYQLGAQHAYVALPEALALRVRGDSEPFNRDGIGLLGVGPEGGVQELLPAQASPRFLPFHSQGIIEGLRTPVALSPPSLASLLADLWEASA